MGGVGFLLTWQLPAAAQSQYYLMMPGADSQPQGTYFFGPGSSQALPVGGMGGGESSKDEYIRVKSGMFE